MNNFSHQLNQPNNLTNSFSNSLNSSNGYNQENFNQENFNQENFNQENLYKSQSVNNDYKMFNNLTNDNLVNMANSIDTITLNGTNLENFSNSNNVYTQPILNEDNTSLIKSLTKEIIHNLRENNIDFNDGLSSSSNTIMKSSNSNNDLVNNLANESANELMDELASESNKNLNKKNKKKKDLEHSIKTFIKSSNPVPATNDYLTWIFDDCFNIKDFIVLFMLYFILSQEMIKDFFSKYFTSLNPDSEGKVNIQGVIVYGLILTVLFMIIRKFF